MENKVLSYFWKFTDDSKMMRLVDSVDDILTIKQDLPNLEEWSKKCQMSFNAKKCKVMHFGKKNLLAKYGIDGGIGECGAGSGFRNYFNGRFQNPLPAPHSP